MELHQFDSRQVKRACNVLQACGIEPTAEVLQALAETAIAHCPNDPDLEKTARSMVAFFQTSASGRQENPWMRLRWLFSVLRLKILRL